MVPEEEDQDHGQLVGLAPGQPEQRVLIVDDRKENRQLLQRLLQDAGFQVQIAGDGLQGVEMFRSWRPHFIWMDIRLPVLGGLEATAKIRALEGGEEVKVVALTASAFAHERSEVLAAGLDDFVRKPFRQKEVFDCLARHLGVRYTYRQVQLIRPAEAGPAGRLDFARLPVQMRKELSEAVLTLDSIKISEIISSVAEHDAPLSDALARIAKRSAFTEILNALQGWKSPTGD